MTLNFKKDFPHNKKNTQGFYLASPYSHPNRDIEHLRFQMISNIAMELHADGYKLLAPICMSHPMKEHGKGGKSSFEYWKDVDLWMIDLCKCVVVVKMLGWNESVGVLAEIEYAESKGYEVYYYE